MDGELELKGGNSAGSLAYLSAVRSRIQRGLDFSRDVTCKQVERHMSVFRILSSQRDTVSRCPSQERSNLASVINSLITLAGSEPFLAGAAAQLLHDSGGKCSAPGRRNVSPNAIRTYIVSTVDGMVNLTVVLIIIQAHDALVAAQLPTQRKEMGVRQQLQASPASEGLICRPSRLSSDILERRRGQAVR